MTIELAGETPATSLNRRLTVWLCRLAGLLLFGVGVFYWARLIGIDPVHLGRFDLMPIWWRIAAPALAVLYPVAGIGLWMTAGWGGVIWVLIAIIEAVMHLGFPALFGENLLGLAAHAWGLGMLAALRVVAWREDSRRTGR
ncbi:DUF6163 family protein [Aurantimonas sp. 22II-16-19i]|uniref:DUF6163 family protein n=1 Tax=Aurantimonas sp. 22II-16-19i TaxID=1317114 RepID=UPI0009F7DC55|nr:DUF6163 family protein [Aurantimonas sp. 22II-16-19i]ORE97458.1 hypothetical protein ATO4_09067 [Aurantimonas sp. 22II-16-19i]